MHVESDTKQSTSGRPATNACAEPCCPVCDGSVTTKLKFRVNGMKIYGCTVCGVEFQAPQPSDARLSAIYSSNYFIGSESAESRARVSALKNATAAEYLATIKPFINRDGVRLLEVGCGSGDFLFEAQSQGFEVEGLEYSEHAAEQANRRLGAPRVHVGSLDTAPLPDNTYDVVAAFDVLEHVRNPRFCAELLYKSIKPGGIIALVTPSLDSWSRRVLGQHWMEYKTEHLTYFNKKSLRILLRNAGFSDISFSPNFKVLTLDYICRHFDRYPVHVVSPILKRVRTATPNRLAHTSFKIVASGIMAIGRKK